VLTVNCFGKRHRAGRPSHLPLSSLAGRHQASSKHLPLSRSAWTFPDWDSAPTPSETWSVTALNLECLGFLACLVAVTMAPVPASAFPVELVDRNPNHHISMCDIGTETVSKTPDTLFVWRSEIDCACPRWVSAACFVWLIVDGLLPVWRVSLMRSGLVGSLLRKWGDFLFSNINRDRRPSSNKQARFRAASL
jgi:hypothetical protein